MTPMIPSDKKAMVAQECHKKIVQYLVRFPQILMVEIKHVSSETLTQLCILMITKHCEMCESVTHNYICLRS